MSKIKEAILEGQYQRERAMNEDLSWEHSQHKDKVYPNCSACQFESEEIGKMLDHMYENRVKECEFGHECSSRCGNDRDCPCDSEHFCSMTQEAHGYDECEGDNCVFHAKRVCDICEDKGYVEIYGGSDADEWGVVDKKTCVCQLT